MSEAEQASDRAAPLSVRRRRRVRRAARRRLSFIPYGFAPIVAFGALWLFAIAPFARDRVEAPVRRSAEAALAELGADWATLSVSGQWVRIEGTPPSLEAGALAVAAVEDAPGATMFGTARAPTRVTLASELEAPRSLADDRQNRVATAAQPAEAGVDAATGPRWTFRTVEGVLLLEGEVRDEATRRRIEGAAGAAIDPPRIARVENRLVVARRAAADGDLEAALKGVALVAACSRGAASLREGRMSLRCEAPRRAVNRIEADARSTPAGVSPGAIDVVAEEEIATCDETLSGLLTARIEFGSGSAEIDRSSLQLLDDLAAAVRTCPGVLRIEGHTDATGSAFVNDGLSLDRSQAVREALIERGAPAERLVAEGVGSRRPVASNATESGRARNRRIEIKVVRASD